MIFSNWNILGNIHLRQFDNKTSSFEVTGDIPEGWNWQLLFTCQDSINIVDMIQDGNRLYVLLTDDILSLNGAYYFQMKATQGELVKHTNIVKIYVSRSISGDATWPAIPTEFTDLEKAIKAYAESAKQSADKAESAVVHSPIIGSNGNWFVWDFYKEEYIDTGVSASGGGSVSDISLGIKGASVNQIPSVKSVDEDGKPSSWDAIDKPKDGVTPNIQIGDVETLEAGSDATASITGTVENPLLNLGIPKGVDGSGGGSGGSSGWTLLGDISLTEDVEIITISQTPDNKPFSVREISFFGGIVCDQTVKNLYFSTAAAIKYGVPLLDLGEVLKANASNTENIAAHIQVLPECMLSRTQHNEYNSTMARNSPSFSASNLRGNNTGTDSIGDPITLFSIGAWKSGTAGVLKAGTHLKFYGR